MAIELALDNDENNHSWKTGYKETLKNNLIYGMKSQIASRISRMDNELINDLETINNLKRQLNDKYDKVNQNLRLIAGEKKFLSNSILDISKELDLMVENERISDVHIQGSIVVVYTKPLYMFDSNNDRYFLGECHFRIDMQNSTITFDNENRRLGYWSENDVHPHISNTGDPCWGTIATTIIELCSQLQLYAVTLMCINFLEQANLDDPAGQYVIMWDKVDDEGKIIEAGGTYGLPNHTRCRSCESWVHDDDLRIAYNEVEESTETDENGNEYTEYGALKGEHDVCLNCREDNYRYIEELEVYVYNE